MSPCQSVDFDQRSASMSGAICILGSAVSTRPQMTSPEICVEQFSGCMPTS